MEVVLLAAVVLGGAALVLMPVLVLAIWRDRRRELEEYLESDSEDETGEALDWSVEPAGVDFELLVQDALETLPPYLRERMSNVEIVVEDEPPAGAPLLGLYEGVPLTRRSGWYGGVAPDRITIYRGPLERRSGGDPARLARAVSRTVLHEVAHHFGISDERLVELDRY